MPAVIEGPPREPTPQTPEQRTATVVGTQQTQTQIANTAFDNVNTLRKQFEAEPGVQDYKTVLPLVDSAMRIQNNKAGDLNLVYAFGKTMDPNSVVREGEQVMATNVGGVSEKVKGYIAQINGQGGLTPVQRTELIEEIRSRGRALQQNYNQRRAFYEDFARRNNIKPEDVVGPHPGAPFVQDEFAYIRAHGGTPKVGGVPVDQAPDLPTETTRGFDNPPPHGDALPPGAEDFRNGFYSAIRGGQIKSPASAAQWVSDYNSQHGTRFRGAADNRELMLAIRAARKGQPFNVGLPRYNPDIADARGQGGIGEKLDAGVRGAADTLSFGLADKIAAAGDTLTNPDSTFGENLARQYAISDYDTEHHFPSRLTGQIAGGLAIPMGAMKTIPQIVAKSAALGGAYGAGSSRSLSDVPQNAILGAAAGGTIGTALGGTGKALGAGRDLFASKLGRTATDEQAAILAAGDAEGVPINAADVFPGTRNTVSTLESMPGASGPIRTGIEAGRDAMAGRVEALGRGGTARENLGEAVQESGRQFVKKANRQAGRLYDRARSLAGNTPIQPVKTKDVLTDLAIREASTPGGTRAGTVIQQYADAFKKRALLNIDGARRMRSELLDRLRTDGGLSKAEATRVTGQIMSAVNEDIEAGLVAKGKGAAAEAYRFADKFYAQSRDEIEQNIQRFIGTDRAPKSVEQTVAAMQSAAGPKGNAKGLTGMLARMSPEERVDYAATLAEGLGRRSPEEPFSPALFVSNARKLSPAARRIVFGADGERSIQNLITLANAKKATVGGLNNSRSGMVTNYRSVLSTVLFGLPGGGAAIGLGQAMNIGAGATGMATGAAIGLTGLGVSRQIAKALMNEDFTRALLRAPATTSPKAINSHMGILRRIASRDPNVRAVVERLEQQLISFANDNASRQGRLVASPDERPQDKKQAD